MMKHERNIDGLKTHAQKKREETFKKVDEAIKRLIKNQLVINFKSVSDESGVATSWLYKEGSVRERIEGLRNQKNPRVKKRNSNSKDNEIIESQKAIIETLKMRVKEQEKKIKELEQKVQIAYSKFYE